MCQSQADGGVRCNHHLTSAAGAALVTYVVTSTGATAPEAKAVVERLEREGEGLPAPSRSEVDAFIDESMYRARHDDSLAPKRRESILRRLGAALGKVLPTGAQFHAWKNMMVETAVRMRRKAVAATVVAGLAVSLAACGEVDGTVVEKDHRDAYTTTYPVKVGKITTFQTKHHPECWKVKVEGEHNGSDCIDKATWDALQVGDHYDNIDG